MTTGDSSLSPAIQSAVAAQVGRDAEAWRYFREAATLDLADRAGSAANGIHLAGAAGVWLAVVRGFVGLELEPDGITTDPRLPESWKSVTLKLQVAGKPVEVRVDRQ